MDIHCDAECVNDSHTPGPLRITELETPIDTRNSDPGPTLRYLAGRSPTKVELGGTIAKWNNVASVISNDFIPKFNQSEKIGVSKYNISSSLAKVNDDYNDDEMHLETPKSKLSRSLFDRNPVDKSAMQFDARKFAHHFIRKYTSPGSYKRALKNSQICKNIGSNIQKGQNGFEYQSSNYNTMKYSSPNDYSDTSLSKFDFSNLKSNMNSIINYSPAIDTHYNTINYTNKNHSSTCNSLFRVYPSDNPNYQNITPDRYHSNTNSMKSIINDTYFHDNYSTLTYTPYESSYSASRCTETNTPYMKYLNNCWNSNLMKSDSTEHSHFSYHMCAPKQGDSFIGNNYCSSPNKISSDWSSDSDNPFKFDSSFSKGYLNKSFINNTLSRSIAPLYDNINAPNSNLTHYISGRQPLKASENNPFNPLSHINNSINSDLWDNSQFDCKSSTNSNNSSKKIPLKNQGSLENVKNCNCALQNELSMLKSIFTEFKADLETIINGINKCSIKSKDSENTPDLDTIANRLNTNYSEVISSELEMENANQSESAREGCNDNLKLQENASAEYASPEDIIEGYRAALTIKRMLHVKSMNSVVPAFTSFLHKRIN